MIRREDNRKCITITKGCPCNICRDFLIEAVLTSTYNLYFGAKIRKIGKPLQTPVFLHKGVYLPRTF